MVFKRHFQQYFSYIVAVSVIGEGNGVLGENPDLAQVTENVVLCTPRHERGSNSHLRGDRH
jgi:hypothetical protein